MRKVLKKRQREKEVAKCNGKMSLRKRFSAKCSSQSSMYVINIYFDGDGFKRCKNERKIDLRLDARLSERFAMLSVKNQAHQSVISVHQKESEANKSNNKCCQKKKNVLPLWGDGTSTALGPFGTQPNRTNI